MTDRELLEAAAKAAGIDYHIDHLDGCAKLIVGGEVWNPLVFDGQALRLAVTLGISIDPTKDSVCAIGGTYKYVAIEIGYGAMLQSATRRAICRIAACIGREKP